MNGKIPHSNKNWTFSELRDYGFKPYQYYIFKNKFSKFWYEKFGDKFFTVDKELKESGCRMDSGKYYIYLDEMGYVDVYFDTDDKNSAGQLLYTGRRDVTLVDIFDAIKWHKRETSLNTLEDELV